MPANTSPIFPLVPNVAWGKLTTANTAKDGTGTVGTIVSGTETWFKSQFGTFVDDTDHHHGGGLCCRRCSRHSRTHHCQKAG